ncbi:MAG: GNAT family N-acetyltransferase [Nitratireductor sp.]|nr:GNAT family N-acetyltransferase [Nitratireductor sp.]
MSAVLEKISAFGTHAREAVSEDETRLAGHVGTTLVRTLAGMVEIEQEWRQLESESGEACLFQSFDWCANFARHAKGREQDDFRIFTLRRDGRLIAILPLATRLNQGIRVLTGMTEPFQQYTDMLISRGERPEAVFRAILPALKNAGADYLHLGQVRQSSPLGQAVANVIRPAGEVDGAPYVQLSDWPDFETYYQSVKSKTRKNMRNARNRLERDAPLTHLVAREGQVLADVIERSFEGREAWLERQGLTSRAFRDSGFAEFVNLFKEPAGTGIQTIAFSLQHGGKPIADQWGFIHNGRYYAFIAGWDQDYEEASPGKLHLGNIIEACYDAGLSAADFMIPAARYKFTWANDAVPVCDHVMPLTVRGHIHNALWLNLIRPMAKQVAYAMPTGMRSLLFRLVMPSRQ